MESKQDSNTPAFREARELVIWGRKPGLSDKQSEVHDCDLRGINILLRFLARLVYGRHYAVGFTCFLPFNPSNHLCGGYYLPFDGSEN